MNLWELLSMLADIVRGLHGGMELAEWAVNASLDLFLHFWFSGLLGFAALWATYYLMRWLWRTLAARRQLNHTSVAAGEGLIWSYSWLVGGFASWLAHCWWDGLLLI